MSSLSVDSPSYEPRNKKYVPPKNSTESTTTPIQKPKMRNKSKKQRSPISKQHTQQKQTPQNSNRNKNNNNQHTRRRNNNHGNNNQHNQRNNHENIKTDNSKFNKSTKNQTNQVNTSRNNQHTNQRNTHNKQCNKVNTSRNNQHINQRNTHNNKQCNNHQNKSKTKTNKNASNKQPVKGLIRIGKNHKNTESFKPEDYLDPPDVRVVFGAATKKFNKSYSVHDVVMSPELFCKANDYTVYEALLAELEASGVQSLFVEWHGDSHVIADDKKQGGKWKKNSPTFQRIVQQIRDYFDMDIKATRFNWYRNAEDWKPFHHDAAAMKPNFARQQNCTVAASFGDEREIGFEHAKNRAMISLPQPNGSMYAFGRDVNIEWRHGVVPIAPENYSKHKGRVSIIAWGWVEQVDLDRSRIRDTP